MLMQFLRTTLVVCMLLVFPLSASAQYDNAERLRIHGSNTLGARLVPALVRTWMVSLGYEDIERIERSVSITEIRGMRDGEPLVVEITKDGSGAGMMECKKALGESSHPSGRDSAADITAWASGLMG